MVSQDILLKTTNLRVDKGKARGAIVGDRVPVVDHKGVEEVEAEVVRLRQPRNLSKVSRGAKLRR